MSNRDRVSTRELFDSIPSLLIPLFKDVTYPWEILPKIKDYIKFLISSGLNGYKEIDKGVYVGENTKIDKNVKIIPPAIIGNGVEIRHGAYLRGNVIICDGCVIGNSTEIKNSIIFENAACPHYNYVGDSIVGNYAHMGAGVICSNLKSDKTEICIKGNEKYNTYLKKMGAILGDRAEIGCGCVLNPGTVIGKYSSVYPLTSIRGVIPERSIVKDSKTIISRI
ncbi:MAG: UDP-N-acetylglucosamine pyrophosphorylase [Clostridia bacterium]|nr:UDP-N-acetylglucosamine pyrophosphorylase [Clostridia bacterium]